MSDDPFDDDELPEDTLVPLVGRGAVVITPKEPFLAWARRTPRTRRPQARSAGAATIFLVPIEIADERQARDWLKLDCQLPFEHLLDCWNGDMDTWPGTRDSWPIFTAWFEVRFIDQVFDLDPEALDDGLDEDDEDWDEDEFEDEDGDPVDDAAGPEVRDRS